MSLCSRYPACCSRANTPTVRGFWQYPIPCTKTDWVHGTYPSCLTVNSFSPTWPPDSGSESLMPRSESTWAVRGVSNQQGGPFL